MGDSNSGFVGVFEQRVHLLRKRLKNELDKKKSDRSKHTLKTVIKEIKEWEEVLHKHRKDHRHCPHCGGHLES